MHLLELWAESVLSSKHFFKFFGLKEPSTNRKFQSFLCGTAQNERKMMGYQIREFSLCKPCALGTESNMFRALFKPFLRNLKDTDNFNYVIFFFIMASQLNNTWAPHLTIFELWRCIWQDYYNISNHYGKRTDWSPIRSVIVRLIT